MNKNMLGLVVSLFMVVSCAVSPNHNAPSAINPPFVPASFEPVQKYSIDTLKKDTLPKKAAPEIKTEYDKLVTKTIVQPVINKDSIISLNYQWQKAYLRVVNRSLKNQDSLKILIIEQGKKADAYYKKASQANYYAEQTKHAETSSNWVFYTGFALTLFFIAWNTRLSWQIKKQTA